jgi:dienelactone hydrolase
MIEQTLDIATEDGAMETFICCPERGGPFPVVLLLMDAPGIREELRDMARRLGSVGYCPICITAPDETRSSGRTCSSKAAPSVSECVRCVQK